MDCLETKKLKKIVESDLTKLRILLKKLWWFWISMTSRTILKSKPKFEEGGNIMQVVVYVLHTTKHIDESSTRLFAHLPILTTRKLLLAPFMKKKRKPQSLLKIPHPLTIVPHPPSPPSTTLISRVRHSWRNTSRQWPQGRGWKRVDTTNLSPIALHRLVGGSSTTLASFLAHTHGHTPSAIARTRSARHYHTPHRWLRESLGTPLVMNKERKKMLVLISCNRNRDVLMGVYIVATVEVYIWKSTPSVC